MTDGSKLQFLATSKGGKVIEGAQMAKSSATDSATIHTPDGSMSFELNTTHTVHSFNIVTINVSGRRFQVITKLLSC